MENLAFHSSLTWKMIILPILTTSLIRYSKLEVGRMYFLNLGVKGLKQTWIYDLWEQYGGDRVVPRGGGGGGGGTWICLSTALACFMLSLYDSILDSSSCLMALQRTRISPRRDFACETDKSRKKKHPDETTNGVDNSPQKRGEHNDDTEDTRWGWKCSILLERSSTKKNTHRNIVNDAQENALKWGWVT